MFKGILLAAAALAAVPAQAADFSGFGISSDSWTRIGAPTSEEILPAQLGSDILRAWLITFSLMRLGVTDTTSDFTIVNAPISLGRRAVLPTDITVEYSAALNRMTIFGTVGGEDLIDTENDLFATIDNVFSAAPVANQVRVSTAASPGGFWQTNYQFATVPEPATWAMMIGGFGAIGAMARRSTRRAVALD